MDTASHDAVRSHEYTTTRGKVIRFVGVQSLLDQLRASFPQPKKPQYPRTSNVTGTTTYFDHDETTLDVEGDEAQTKANHAQWDAYAAEVARVSREYGAALMRLVLLRGIRYDEPQDDAWIKEQTFIGLTVPEDPIERKLHYITTELIEVGDAVEAERVLLGVLAASGIDEEVLSAMADSFRHPLGESDGHESTGPQDAEHGQSVVLQPPVRTGGRSDLGGRAANVPVRRHGRNGQGVPDRAQTRAR